MAESVKKFCNAKMTLVQLETRYREERKRESDTINESKERIKQFMHENHYHSLWHPEIGFFCYIQNQSISALKMDRIEEAIMQINAQDIQTTKNFLIEESSHKKNSKQLKREPGLLDIWETIIYNKIRELHLQLHTTLTIKDHLSKKYSEQEITAIKAIDIPSGIEKCMKSLGTAKETVKKIEASYQPRIIPLKETMEEQTPLVANYLQQSHPDTLKKEISITMPEQGKQIYVLKQNPLPTVSEQQQPRPVKIIKCPVRITKFKPIIRTTLENVFKSSNPTIMNLNDLKKTLINLFRNSYATLAVKENSEPVRPKIFINRKKESK